MPYRHIHRFVAQLKLARFAHENRLFEYSFPRAAAAAQAAKGRNLGAKSQENCALHLTSRLSAAVQDDVC
jgi:hypothetical protein